jgi:hypothetical protein
LEINKEGYPCLLSGGAPDSHCRRSGDLFPILAQTTVADSWQLAHRTLSGAHRTVRCPLPTVGAGHASPADCAADRYTGDRWLTGQSSAPPDSSVNYSCTPPNFSREWPVHRSLAWRTRQSGVPDRAGLLAVHSRVLQSFLFLFLALRQYMLVLKTMY